jgi:putative ABC transport system permease protein
MIVANILHRPVRTAVSILAIAIEVVMVLIVVGLTGGMVHETAKRVEGLGADLMLQPPGSSYLFGVSSAPMPIKIGNRLAELDHVLAVTPVLFQFNATGGINVIYGIDMASFDRVTGGFVYHKGGPFTGPDDLLVDDLYARANHVKVGQAINLLNHDFRVTGIVEHGKGARLFIPLSTAQDMAGAHDKTSIFFVKCTDPGYTDDVVESIRQLLPTYKVLSVRDYETLMTSNNLPALNTFVAALIAVAVSIGFLVIFLSMYTTITERTREIGILKSLGASKRYIISAILREAGLLCAFGIVAGWMGSLIGRRVIMASFPTLTVDLTVVWGVRAAVLALAGTLVGAFYPAFRAAQLDPVDALSYE